MQGSRRGLYVALGLIAGGVVAFFAILGVLGIDPDKQDVGLFGWVLGGVLIGPGFGYLIRWRKQQDEARRAAKVP